ncbi:hypothetical protein N7527_007001 [Penicillium freii]|nr:hypothetical protein N7527_007001 [Penicillium freii]
MAEELPSDDQHIFSEFEDPKRRDLIARFVKSDAARFGEIPLCNYLALWFSDMEVLENCWPWLETFRGEDRMIEWKAQLLTGGMVDTEQVSKLITLEIQALEYWDRANFAFRPTHHGPRQEQYPFPYTNAEAYPVWLKWNLSRIAAMQGGGEEDSDDDPTLFTCDT